MPKRDELSLFIPEFLEIGVQASVDSSISCGCIWAYFESHYNLLHQFMPAILNSQIFKELKSNSSFLKLRSNPELVSSLFWGVGVQLNHK